MKQSRRSNSSHSYMEVLFFLYVCPQVVLLGKSNIALFSFRLTYGHSGGDTFEAIKEEQFLTLYYGSFVLSICVSSGCAFGGSLTLHCLH